MSFLRPDDIVRISRAAASVDLSSDPDAHQLQTLAHAIQQHIDAEHVVRPDTPRDEAVVRAAKTVNLSQDHAEAALKSYGRLFKDVARDSIVGVLPLILRIKGKPFTMYDHYPMEPMFRIKLPQQLLLRCGRQVSKSTSMAARSVVQSITTPHFNSLFVTPLSEQVRRFSSNFVRPFIADSPLYHAIVDASCDQRVLQRSFKNRSTMYFSYCFNNADRVRGIASDQVTIDEGQDLDFDLLPVILETMSASRWQLLQIAGTPKTLDNTIEKLWERSSMAEWVTRCAACNHYNIASMHHDLLKMIGAETVVCAKCERPINPRPAFHPDLPRRGTGFWLHTHPDRAATFPGYHAPQVIFPMHFDNPRKWSILRQKTDPSHTPYHMFVNEVLGEGTDVGARMVSVADLKAACGRYGKTNKYATALAEKLGYYMLAVGVDWGGSTAPYGAGRAGLLLQPENTYSYTALAVLGMLPDGRIDVLYTYRFNLMGDHIEEARACLTAWNDFDEGRRAVLFCHDANGAGSVRDTLMIQAGLPVHLVYPCLYMHAPTRHVVETKTRGGRPFFVIDKTRSVGFVCQAIKTGFISFPAYETCKQHLEDFLALIEDKIDRAGGSSITRVIRVPGKPDDIAHAVTYAAMCLWKTSRFPSMSSALTVEQYVEDAATTADKTYEDYFD